MMPAIGLLLPGVASWLMLRACGVIGAPTSRMFGAALALAAGIGLSSVTTFWFANLAGGLKSGFVRVDAAVWVAVGALGWWYGRRRGATPAEALDGTSVRPRPTVFEWFARAAFALVAVSAVLTVAAQYRAAPFGEWDAWAIWNQKARFLVRGGDDWTQSLRILWSNPSHPWLVSASVARLWSYAGEETTLAPALLSGVLAASVVLAMVGALAPRGAWAWIAGTAVMAPAAFTQLAAAQTADQPVGTFILLSIATLSVGALRRARTLTRALVLGGMFAALAAWTKNEGSVFFLGSALFTAVVFARRHQLALTAWWMLGAAPVILTVLWFKFGIAPDVPLYGSDQPQTFAAVIGRSFSVDEHLTIVKRIGQLAPQWGGPMARGSLLVALAAALASASAGGSRTARFVLAVACVMIAAYYATIVMLPFDADWLVSTTFERFFMQLWPSFVLAGFSWQDGGVPDNAAGSAADAGRDA